METDEKGEALRVLIVDDEPDILKFLGKCLLKRGLAVQATSSPVEALKILERQDFDLILSDIKMPQMDGIELLKKVKETRPSAEVILMTGYATVETAVGSMKLGAFDYVVKPFSIQEIWTAIQRAEERLNRSRDSSRFQNWDRMKEDFLRNTSHELRTPITSIHTASKMLLEGLPEKEGGLGEAQLKMIAIIDRNSEKMIRLIDDLLDAFRFAGGKAGLRKVTFSVEKMISETVEEFLAPCQERGLALEGDVQAGLPEIEADPVKIRQAFLNLLGNAMKFTPPGGRVTLGARKTGSEMAEFFVKDTGAGIPLEQQEKIFEAFYQVDGSLTRGKRGLGLGLSLVKKIVEAHGGRVSVRSEPAKGSLFFFLIPWKTPQGPAASPPSPGDFRTRTAQFPGRQTETSPEDAFKMRTGPERSKNCVPFWE